MSGGVGEQRAAALWGAVRERPTYDDSAPLEGLRERKKRLMRQQLSDTATGMFLDRGFDAVRVSEVAQACGVSEKTVYNYFPTKESLLLDREDAMTAAIRTAVGPGGSGSPVAALLAVLAHDVGQMTDWFATLPDAPAAMLTIRQFADLVESTPSLRAHQRDMMDRLVVTTAEALAERAGMSPDDPEPQIAADALVGLWRIQFRALKIYADGVRAPHEVGAAVTADVARAARLVDAGLWSFGVEVEASDAGSLSAGDARARVAAAAASQARAQVHTAIGEAKRAWHDLRTMAREHEAAERAQRLEMKEGAQQVRRDAAAAAQQLRQQVRAEAKTASTQVKAAAKHS